MCAIIIEVSSNSRSFWINLVQLIRPLFALAQIIHSVMSISDRIKVMRCTFFCIRLFCVFILNKKKCFRLFSTKIAQRAEAIVRKKKHTREDRAQTRDSCICESSLSFNAYKTSTMRSGQLNPFYGADKSKSRFEPRHSFNFSFLSLSIYLYLACWEPIIHLRQRQFLLMKIKCSSLDFTQYWPHLSKGLCGPRTSRETEKRVFKLLSPRHS